jgi:hypothetical protein
MPKIGLFSNINSLSYAKFVCESFIGNYDYNFFKTNSIIVSGVDKARHMLICKLNKIRYILLKHRFDNYWNYHKFPDVIIKLIIEYILTFASS